jgi:hypothetical protein
MQLKDFVTETLRQIVDGVKDAQQAAKVNGAVIAPYNKNFEKIEFDVAVTATEGTGTEGKVGINIWSIAAGEQNGVRHG